MHELAGSEPPALDALGRDLPAAPSEPRVGLFEQLYAGCYPRIHDRGLEPQDWLANYFQTYLERDVRDILSVGDLGTFRRFVGLCAGRNGQLLNLSALGADCGIAHTTARRWLSVLQASFLVRLLEPHHRNFNKRIIKSPKLYFSDTGLLCYLLRVRSPEELRRHSARGAIFECHVISELLKRALHAGREPDLYFWRDSAGHEVDLLLDQGTAQVPVEIKSGETVAEDFFRGLDHWRSLAGDEDVPAVLIHGGDRSYRRSGVTVYGWWEF